MSKIRIAFLAVVLASATAMATGFSDEVYGTLHDHDHHGYPPRGGGGPDGAQTPEPGTFVLVGLGVAGLAVVARRKRT